MEVPCGMELAERNQHANRRSINLDSLGRGITMRKAQFLFLFFVVIAFPISAQAARDITLPFTLSFDTYDYSDLIWDERSCGTEHLTNGCYSGSCFKITPPTTDSDNACGLGEFLNFSTPQLNVRFIMKIGTTFYSTSRSGAEGYGEKLVILNPTGGERPILFLLRNNGASPYNYALCIGNDTSNVDCQCGGTHPCYWPNGNDTLEFDNGTGGDYAGQWVCVELQATIGGQNRVYITTQDGVFNETLYVSVNSTSSGLFNRINIIGGYWNQYNLADANTYIIFDELKIDNKYIGPPAGFLNNPAPRPPAGVQVIPIQ